MRNSAKAFSAYGACVLAIGIVASIHNDPAIGISLASYLFVGGFAVFGFVSAWWNKGKRKIRVPQLRVVHERVPALD